MFQTFETPQAEISFQAQILAHELEQLFMYKPLRYIIWNFKGGKQIIYEPIEYIAWLLYMFLDILTIIAEPMIYNLPSYQLR